MSAWPERRDTDQRWHGRTLAMRGGRKDEEGRACSKSGNFQLCSHAINLGTTLDRTPLLTSLKRYSPWRAPSLAVAHVRPDAVRPER